MEGIHNCSSSSNNLCVNTFGSYRCQCNTGYQDINGICTGLVASSYYSFSFICLSLDINECAGNIDSCSQMCNNTQGSYFCSCLLGYQLDGRYSCRGL